MSLRLRMILAFTGFTAIVLGVLWLTQTVWLDDIYRFLKTRDLEHCAEEVTAVYDPGSEENEEAVSEIARRYAVCVSVFEIGSTRSASNALTVHMNPLCYIHTMRSENQLIKMYQDAQESGGESRTEVSLGTLVGTEKGDGGNVISARTLTKNGVELFMLFDTELAPLASTVETLRLQLIVISIILLILSTVLALILSARLSAPLRRMSREANKLALGDYTVNFDGTGSRETENLSGTLNRAAYELSQLDKMQKDLIANVSHDLRTPLTMIAGYTEAMRDLPGEATPENMQIVLDETSRLSSLVGDMLEVSRYQGGVQTLRTTTFDYTACVRETLERYARLREKEGYTVRFEAEKNVWVTADRDRILQVLYNLINNAVNYTGDDKTVVVRQTVEKTDGEDFVLTEVIDTGIGIPEEELPLVWERYYKVNDFHKRENMGTGLGLSIVKSILLLHQAPFGVRSKVGEGSDFWFKLPSVPEPAETEPTP